MSFCAPVKSYEDYGLYEYMGKVKTFPVLSEDEEKNLAMRWINGQDTSAARTLVESHLRLVVKIAMDFRGYGLAMMDVISEGNLGLMQAVKKFDPKMGYRLSTYAIWWIKSAMQDYVMRVFSKMKIGTGVVQKKLFFKLRSLKNKIMAERGQYTDASLDDETANEIAKKLSVTVKDVKDMNNLLYKQCLSLDDPKKGEEDGDEGSLIDNIGNNSEFEDYEYKEESRQKNLIIRESMKKLDEREKYIIDQRMIREKPNSLKNLASKYAVSPERIRQIEKRAIEKMKKFINSKYPSLIKSAV